MQLNIRHLLDKPENPTNKAAIILPGVSGKVITDSKYQTLVKELIKSNYACLRLEIWKSKEDLDNKSFEYLISDLKKAIDFLSSQGYQEINLIGKSLGGAVILVYTIKNQDQRIKSIITWAPAIGYSDISNLQLFYKKKFKEYGEGMAIKLSPEDLKEVKSETLIINGKSDNIIPYQNSESLVNSIKNAELHLIPEADHSYTQENWFEEVKVETIKFIKINS